MSTGTNSTSEDRENCERPNKKAKLEVPESKYFNFLKNKLNTDRERNENCDYRVQVGDQTFNCHRSILTCNSEYFATLLKNNLKVAEKDYTSLPSEIISESIFSKLLLVMYGEPLKIEDDVIPIIVASSYLQMPYFVDCCKEYIQKNIKYIDVWKLISMPQLQCDSSLYSFLKEVVCKNFSVVYSNLAGVSLDLFEELLSHPELYVLNKEHVFDFGRNWIRYDLQHRKQHIRKIFSTVKPFDVPCDNSLRLVSILENHLESYYDIDVSLNILLTSCNIKEKVYPAMSYYFGKSNECFHIGGIPNRRGPIEFLELYTPPLRAKSSTKYEGAIVNGMLYFAAELESNDIIFCRYTGLEDDSWVELNSPKKMPESLVSCNSTLYSYESLSNDQQFSFLEPNLNRWMKIPSGKYLREQAGIASNNIVLYMVGGILKTNVHYDMAACRNLVELYDSRCGKWFPTGLSTDPFDLRYEPYSGRVCYLNNCIYAVSPSGHLVHFDVRNYKWLHLNYNSIRSQSTGYLTKIGEKICFFYENADFTLFTSQCSVISQTTMRDVSNIVKIKPIVSP